MGTLVRCEFLRNCHNEGKPTEGISILAQEIVDEHECLAEIDRSIRCDSARRGLFGTEREFGPLCPGHLGQAAQSIARTGQAVGIVTGFFIPHGEPPAAETDGPLGAVVLADILQRIGVSVRLITDELCHGALVAAARAAGIPPESVLASPLHSANWRSEFFESPFGRELTHLVAVERVGPCHSLESLARQLRTTTPPIDEFRRLVATEYCDCCHNMRGAAIDAHTGDLHELFVEIRELRPAAKTIGIGDGANEIGMGVIPWEDLVCRLAGDYRGRVPCRIGTDWNILAGTSNWGGYALAAAILLLRGDVEPLRRWDGNFQQRVLQKLVEHGPSVDGVTGRQELTVDGLPFAIYIQPCDEIHRLLGFA